MGFERALESFGRGFSRACVRRFRGHAGSNDFRQEEKLLLKTPNSGRQILTA
jgi:hypothetical protein